MLPQLIRINKKLFFAAQKNINTAKFAGSICINHLDSNSNSTDKDVLGNIEALSDILKYPEYSYIYIKYGSYGKHDLTNNITYNTKSLEA